MRIYKHKTFARFAKSEKIKDDTLVKAVMEVLNGQFEANLGGGLYKKRVARKGEGKRGGYRTLLAFKRDDRTVFVYGFAKNEKADIANDEKVFLKTLAKTYLSASDTELEKLVKKGELVQLR